MRPFGDGAESGSARWHWSTRLGAAIFGLAALLILGPVTVAVLLLRCCDDSTGPSIWAWALLLALLLCLTLAAAALGAAAVALLRRLIVHLRPTPPTRPDP
jgi:hypothetical protein